MKLQLLEQENGKWYPAGSFNYAKLEKALDAAKFHLKDEESGDYTDIAVVVHDGETLYGFGGKGMNEQTAMKEGTGTVNRLTKKADQIRHISASAIIDINTASVKKGNNMDKKLIAKQLLKLAHTLIAEDKEWTKAEWEAYKKEHPGTKIKPKMKQEGKSKNFSEHTDTWFDTAAKHSGNPKHEDDHIKAVKKIVNHGDSQATKEKLDQVHEHLKKSKHPAAPAMAQHVEAIKNGKFNNEFKNVDGGTQHDGKSSQVKEFFSQARQGLGYND